MKLKTNRNFLKEKSQDVKCPLQTNTLLTAKATVHHHAHAQGNRLVPIQNRMTVSIMKREIKINQYSSILCGVSNKELNNDVNPIVDHSAPTVTGGAIDITKFVTSSVLKSGSWT